MRFKSSVSFVIASLARKKFLKIVVGITYNRERVPFVQRLAFFIDIMKISKWSEPTIHSSQ